MHQRTSGLAFLSLLALLLAACGPQPVEQLATLGATVNATPPQTLSPTHTVTLTPPLPPTPTLEPSPLPTDPPPTEPPFATHVVRAGDTLLGLARQYEVPIAAIQLGNSLGDSTIIHIGQALTIPLQTTWEGASYYWIVHVVKGGETLASIAQDFDLDVAPLRDINDLEDADQLPVGRELVLPLDRLPVTPSPTPTPTPPPTLTPTPTPVPPTELPPSAPPPAPPPADLAAWPQEVFRLINEERARYGLGPLVYNDALAAAAQGHANDCSQRGWCSHIGSDGSTVQVRVARAGYQGPGWAECWVQSGSPGQGVFWWMDEVPPNDAHLRTILSTWLQEVGVGVSPGPWDTYFFIADFGRP